MDLTCVSSASFVDDETHEASRDGARRTGIPPHTADAVQQVILSRRSCRSFVNRPIPREELLELIQAGANAPSGGNTQNQRFLLVHEKEEIERIGRCRWVYPYNSTASEGELRVRKPSGFLGSAAALIFVFADAALNDPQSSGEYHLWESLEAHNCAASIQNILLLAAAKGIGSCWVCCSEGMNYTRLLSGGTWRHVFSEYDIPASYKIQGAIVLGYPKRVDGSGYPAGEKRHGLALQKVQRAPVDHYLIGKRNEHLANPKLRGIPRLKVRCYRRAIATLLAFVKKLDRRTSAIEMPLCAARSSQEKAR